MEEKTNANKGTIGWSGNQLSVGYAVPQPKKNELTSAIASEAKKTARGRGRKNKR